MPSRSANGRMSSSTSRSTSEYGGCSVSTGAIGWMRRELRDVEVGHADVADQPSSFSSASAAQPSSMSVVGVGPVDLVEVDRVDAEALQAGLDLAPDRVALEVVHDPAAAALEQRAPS